MNVFRPHHTLLDIFHGGFVMLEIVEKQVSFTGFLLLFILATCSFFLDSPKKRRTKEKTEAPLPRSLN
ncbi:MAG: hypothetical protein CSB13_01710 [Chloroflexi bacterium]|nr:MAG: hypothetical protein CSB13_01710 [Chloroflexota bacterium]